MSRLTIEVKAGLGCSVFAIAADMVRLAIQLDIDVSCKMNDAYWAAFSSGTALMIPRTGEVRYWTLGEIQAAERERETI